MTCATAMSRLSMTTTSSGGREKMLADADAAPESHRRVSQLKVADAKMISLFGARQGAAEDGETMLAIVLVLGVLWTILVVVSLSQPLAAGLRLSPVVLLAVIG